MNWKLYTLVICLCMSSTLGMAQRKKRSSDNHAFQGRSLVTSLGFGFFGYSYGYGKVSGFPLLASIEYGVHRYVGVGVYGGMLHRKPVWGERQYKMSVYSAGIRINAHFYNVIDDLVKGHDLRSDLLDLYITGNVGADTFKSNLPIGDALAVLAGVGFGAKVYPFKRSKQVGFHIEFSNLLTPFLVGASYRF